MMSIIVRVDVLIWFTVGGDFEASPAQPGDIIATTPPPPTAAYC